MGMSRLSEKHEVLLRILQRERRLLIAFSGGCDSTLLLAIARRALGKENVLAVTALSASLPDAEKEKTEALSRELDVSYRAIYTAEFENPQYVANPSNRCFFCKDELF